MGEIQDSSLLYDLIVIGASAGGIEALVQLVSTLPADFRAPLVIAQHLDPARASHLEDILHRRSALPVHTITEGPGVPLSPGVIYLTPPDRDVEITDHTVSVGPGAGGRSMPSIDRLFISAAHAHDEHLIAVILTGSGTDGAIGAREVKAAGGTVVIEDPVTASYPSMPAALAPATVDFVAPLEKIGTLLQDLVSGLRAPTASDNAATLAAVLALVNERSGIDFSKYKRPTLLRRLQRRMLVTQTTSLADYLRYLQQRPDEYPRLVASFLISVTEFFRDAEPFTELRERVFPDLIATARQHNRKLRIWSAGCATGEEAYSLAILLSEELGNELAQFNVRIFATDLDPQAIGYARRGVYPTAAIANIPSPLRERYFSPVADGWAIAYKLRSMVIFGEHDLGQHAPFPQMDLVVCRNVLIYFTTELQKRALQVFAYALRDGGYLVMGQAESVTPLANLFAPLNDRIKIFRRHGERILVPPVSMSVQLTPMTSVEDRVSPLLLSAGNTGNTGNTETADTPKAPTQVVVTAPRPVVLDIMPGLSAAESVSEHLNILRRATTTRERLGGLLLGLAVGVVIVDSQYDIQLINSAACQLLGIYRPAIGKDILHLVERVRIDPIRAILDAVFHSTPQPTTSEYPIQSITVETIEDTTHTIQITVCPVVNDPPSSYVHEPGEESTGASDSDEDSFESIPHVSVFLLIVPGSSDAIAETIGVATVNSGVASDDAADAPLIPPDQPQQVTRSRRTARRELRAAEPVARPQEQDHDQQLGVALTALDNARRQSKLLLQSMQKLETANQELQRSNLKLQQAHEEASLRQEEIQAADEEVRTLNEELQATNEELETLNEEMEATNEELRATNDDLLLRTQELQQLAEQHEGSVAASADVGGATPTGGDRDQGKQGSTIGRTDMSERSTTTPAPQPTQNPKETP
ncbi:MAG TPA: CheR family methyltransferase [Ktedonobacterales bacterium]|nr:CheR family methyltransferase [Ktedonobacterales bacterium]